jgi:flagellar biosynthesis component FlhA
LAARVPAPETPVVAITSSAARYFFRQITETSIPNLSFMAHHEIPGGVRIQSLGTIV